MAIVMTVIFCVIYFIKKVQMIYNKQFILLLWMGFFATILEILAYSIDTYDSGIYHFPAKVINVLYFFAVFSMSLIVLR